MDESTVAALLEAIHAVAVDDLIDRWAPLSTARWTLVATFEENGRRYLLARESQTCFEMLADREREVVLQAALGFTNKEIAYSLGISDSTVRVLVSRAARKMGVRSRKELVSHPSLERIVRERKGP